MGGATLEVKVKISHATGSESFNQELSLDLNQLIVRHPAATYYVRIESGEFADLNIYSGDILVIDRSIESYEKRIVVAIIEGEFVVRKIDLDGVEHIMNNELTIWGVVTYIIHKA